MVTQQSCRKQLPNKVTKETCLPKNMTVAQECYKKDTVAQQVTKIMVTQQSYIANVFMVQLLQ